MSHLAAGNGERPQVPVLWLERNQRIGPQLATSTHNIAMPQKMLLKKKNTSGGSSKVGDLNVPVQGKN